MKILGKVVLWILVALAGLIGLVFVWAFLFYPAEYVMRAIRWRDADVYDYQKFPARPIAASPSLFHFEEESVEVMVRALFEKNPAIHDLDGFISTTVIGMKHRLFRLVGLPNLHARMSHSIEEITITMVVSSMATMDICGGA